MEVILYGNKINSPEDFHLQIYQVLEFPEYYGANLDALWDCLSERIDISLTIIWNDFAISKAALGHYSDMILQCFKDFENQNSSFRIVIIE